MITIINNDKFSLEVTNFMFRSRVNVIVIEQRTLHDINIIIKVQDGLV